MNDLREEVKVEQAYAPTATTADQDGADVDLQNAGDNFQSALVVFDIGLWTDGTHTFDVEEADDDGTGQPDTYSSVDSDDLSDTPPVVDDNTDDEQVYTVEYTGTKQYIRPVVTVAGASSGAVYGMSVVLGHPTTLPVS